MAEKILQIRRYLYMMAKTNTGPELIYFLAKCQDTVGNAFIRGEGFKFKKNPFISRNDWKIFKG